MPAHPAFSPGGHSHTWCRLLGPWMLLITVLASAEPESKLAAARTAAIVSASARLSFRNLIVLRASIGSLMLHWSYLPEKRSGRGREDGASSGRSPAGGPSLRHELNLPGGYCDQKTD
jgi:hypothetical protein